MKNFVIYQGETLRLTVTVEEEGATTAQLFAVDDLGNTITKLSSFVGMEADLTVTDTDVPAGDYEYYIKITWDDGTVDILAKGKCTGDKCEKPKITICEIEGS